MSGIAGKRFVLAGRFPGVPREKIRQRIEAAGGVVVRTLSRGTDFLVVGDGAADKIPTAMVYGIGWLELDGLNELLGGASGPRQERRKKSRRASRPLGVPKSFFALGVCDGDEYFLDTATGRVESRLVPAVTAALPIEPSAVSLESIADAFRLAALETSIDDEGDLRVHIYNDEANVLQNPKRGWLQFVKAFKIDADASEKLKYAAVNELNQDWEMVRFYISAPDRLVADYVLPYEQGISPMQLVLSLQGFVATVAQALRSSEKVKGIA